MKKIIPLLFIVTLFFAGNAFACSFVEGTHIPSIEESLLKDNTALYIVQPLSNGKIVATDVHISNKNGVKTPILQILGNSCETRFDEFKTNEFIVVIASAGEDVIKHEILGGQFSLAFLSLNEAMEKYDELLNKWEARIHNINHENYVPAPYTILDYSLKPGTKNDDVTKLQTALKQVLALGDDFKIDGSYGPGTQEVVKQFQESVSLENDGLAGVKTQTALAEKVSSYVSEKKPETQTPVTSEGMETPENLPQIIQAKPFGYTLRPGMKTDDVKVLQTALRNVLSLGDDFKIDGSYGPGTQAMVKRFQESVSLENDGLAGVKTQTALFNGTLDDGVTEIKSLSKPEIDNNVVVGENVAIESEVIKNKIKES